MLTTCFFYWEKQQEAAHRQQTVVSVSKGKDLAQCTGPSTAMSMCSYRTWLWIFTDGPENINKTYWQALFTFRYLTSSPGTSLAPAWTSWQYWKNLCKCMSWKRWKVNSVQQPQFLPAPTFQLTCETLLTDLQQRARSMYISSKAPVTSSGTPGPQLPSPRTTAQLWLFHIASLSASLSSCSPSEADLSSFLCFSVSLPPLPMWNVINGLLNPEPHLGMQFEGL